MLRKKHDSAATWMQELSPSPLAVTSGDTRAALDHDPAPPPRTTAATSSAPLKVELHMVKVEDEDDNNAPQAADQSDCQSDKVWTDLQETLATFEETPPRKNVELQNQSMPTPCRAENKKSTACAFGDTAADAVALTQLDSTDDPMEETILADLGRTEAASPARPPACAGMNRRRSTSPPPEPSKHRRVQHSHREASTSTSPKEDVASSSSVPKTSEQESAVPVPGVASTLEEGLAFTDFYLTRVEQMPPHMLPDGFSNGLEMLESRMNDGFDDSTAFSGVEAPVCSLRLLHSRLQERLGRKIRKPILSYSIEWNTHCQKEILAFDDSACVFGDISSFSETSCIDQLKQKPAMTVETLAPLLAKGMLVKRRAFCLRHQRLADLRAFGFEVSMSL